MGANFGISHHAAERYIERVDGECNIKQARAGIRAHAKAIETALGLGCKCVRLGGGQRLILDCRLRQVVTVIPTQPKITSSIQHSGRAFHFGASKRQARFGELEQ